MTDKNKAIAALVCGVLGLVGGFIPVVQYFTGVLAILGIVFGALAMKTAQGSDRSMAIGGLVCGIVAVAETILAVACVACAACAVAGAGFMTM